MQGKIVKGISGFYYVHVVESGIYECKAKGIFRQQKMKPLVGDDVEIDIISEEKKTGKWVCQVCGYVYEGDELPADFKCPVCGQGADKFKKVE